MPGAGLYDPGTSAAYPIFRSHGERLPLLLRIHAETRNLALEAYEICFSTVIDSSMRFAPVPVLGNELYWRNTGSDTIIRSFSSAQISRSVTSRPCCRSKDEERTKRSRTGELFRSKGIYFQPDVDQISLQDVVNTPDLSKSLYKFPLITLKTKNIRKLVIDHWFCSCTDHAFCELFVPHIFAKSDDIVQRTGIEVTRAAHWQIFKCWL